MHPIRHVPLIMSFLLIATTISQAGDPKSDVAIVKETVGRIWLPLIEIDFDASDPFVLNGSAARILVQADNEIAAKRLYKIQKEMAELIAQYPSTRAGKEAAEMIDKAGLKVAWNYIYPKNTFGSYTPHTR